MDSSTSITTDPHDGSQLRLEQRTDGHRRLSWRPGAGTPWSAPLDLPTNRTTEAAVAPRLHLAERPPAADGPADTEESFLRAYLAATGKPWVPPHERRLTFEQLRWLERRETVHLYGP